MATGLVHFFDESRLMSAAGGASGGTVFFYYTGTSNLAPIYSDIGLTTPMVNPVSVAVGAVLPNIYLSPDVTYRRRIVFTDGTVQDVDPIATGNAGNLGSSVLSVKNSPFNAKGDGVTDDTAAVLAALSYIATNYPNGARLYFPKGTYKLTAALPINSNGVTLEGDSLGGTTLMWASATSDGIYLQGLSSPGVYNITIRDLNIDHSVTKTAGAAIRMYRANQCVVDRVNIGNCWNAFDLKTINNVILSRVVAAEIKGAYGCKFWSLSDGTERSDVLTITDTVFQLNYHGGDGILWDGFAQTLRLYRVGILSAVYGLRVRNTGASASNIPGFGEFSDVEIDGNTGSAVKIEAGSVYHFNGCDVFNLATATGPVVDISGDIGVSYTNSISWNGGRIFGGQFEAVKFGARDLLISGARIGGGNSLGYSAISLLANAQDILIEGNQIGQAWGSYISKYTYGVNVADPVFRCYIADNSFYGCLGEVNNLSTSGTVEVGPYLNRAGTPNWPNTIVRRSDNNTATFLDKLLNSSNANGAQVVFQLETGLANSFVRESLINNSGTPYSQIASGSAVTTRYADFDTHIWRTNGAVEKARLTSARLAMNLPVQLKSYTFATLPGSPATGDMAVITDCNTAVFNAAAAGGGANVVKVCYLGGSWKVA